MTDCSDDGKSSWPELVGMQGVEAAGIIRKENPKVGTVIVNEGMMVTMDYRCDTVRIWVDKHGIVKLSPHIA